MPASPRATGPVRAASPERSALSSAAPSSGPSMRPGSCTPACRSRSIAWATSVTRWFAPIARAAWYSGRADSSIHSGSPPISMTSANAAVRSSPGAVTPKQQPARRCTSTGVPVNVIAGCSASGNAPARSAGSSTEVPYRPDACTRSWPGRTAPVSARPRTSAGSASSGTVSSTRSARASTSAGSTSGTPGSSASARRRDASDTPLAATGWCPASFSAAASTGPTRPAPTTPTVSLAGFSSTTPPSLGDPLLVNLTRTGCP